MIYPSYDFENSLEDVLLKMIRGNTGDVENETNTRENTNSSKNASTREYNNTDDERIDSIGEQDTINSNVHWSFKERTNFEKNFTNNSSRQENEIQGTYYGEKYLDCEFSSEKIDENNEFITRLHQNGISQFSQLNIHQGQGRYEFFLQFYKIFRGQFFSLSLSQKGSKMLQDYVSIIPAKILTKIFDEIKNYLPELIMSTYGNYFSRLLYIYINFEEKLFYLNKIKEKFYFIATHRIGTYPLQYIIEHVNTHEEKILLIDCLETHKRFLLQLSTHEFAVHVIDKILTACDENLSNEIFHFCLENFMKLALDRNGIFLIKRMMNKSENTTTNNKIMQIISENFAMMINDTYANYAILYMIEVIFIFIIK